MSDQPPDQLDFGQLYRDNADFLWRSIRRMGISENNASDVLQEVFLAAHRQLDEFEGRSQLRTWLFAIAKYTVANEKRKMQGRQRKWNELGRESLEPAPPETPDLKVLRLELAQAAESALAKLKPKHREVMVLVDFEGFSISEAAKAQGLKKDVAWGILRTARKSFRASIPPGILEGNKQVQQACPSHEKKEARA